MNHFAQDIVSLITTIERTEQNTVLRTVAAAILSNVPSLSTIYINQIFETLNQALDINHRSLLAKLSSSIPLDEEKNETGLDVEVNGAENMEEEDETQASARRRKQDLPTVQDIEIKHAGWILEAQRIAAETITNLCSTDDNGNINSSEFVIFIIAIDTKLNRFHSQKRKMVTTMIYPMQKVSTTTIKIHQTRAAYRVTNFQSKFWSQSNRSV